jgi:excisionase family DNA binding protein
MMVVKRDEQNPTAPRAPSPWLTVREAAARAKCGVKTIYREVRAGRLKAARVGGRRDLRLLTEWIDEWLIRTSEVTLVPANDKRLGDVTRSVTSAW